MRSLFLFVLFCLSLSLLLFVASAQGSSSSSSSAVPAPSPSSSSSVGNGTASISSSPSPSGYSLPCINRTISSSAYTTYYSSICAFCSLRTSNITGNLTLQCSNTTLYCYTTLSNSTLNGTGSASLPNITSCSNVSSSYIPIVIPPTTAEIIAAAYCPTVNPTEAALVTDFSIDLICAGGAVDNQHTCVQGAGNPSCDASTLAQGTAQDSIYSTNPPDWWRCVYQPPVVFNATCFNETTNSTGCYQAAVSVGDLQVVDPNCHTDGTLCTPRRYMTQIARLKADGTQQWPGQYLPPYTQYNNMVMAVVMAGAATVEASIFYPYVDELQLIQLVSSFNYSFLSFSASTRIVVEFIGGVITHSRTRINATCAYVVPFFTLIVDMSQGQVDQAYWQDDCTTCAIEAYVYSDDGGCNCGVAINTCIGYNTTTGLPTTSSSNSNVTQVSCDLQIYLGFSGTDSNGAILTSSSRTIANFRKWSFSSIYGSALNFYSGLPSLSGNFAQCTTYNENGQCAT